MFNKIFKTILILCICLGISIPSNAAVSVSDNSAFITRSEALAISQSLSERIIMLENTEDNKINHLITSYLERSGVWNAQQQLLQNYSQTKGTTSQTVSSNNAIGKEDLFTVMFLRNTTKSGVFTAEIRYKGVGYSGQLNLCRIGYMGQVKETKNLYSNSGFDLTCSIYEDNTVDRLTHTAADFINYSDLRYSVLVGTAIGQRKVSSAKQDYIACMNLPVNDMIRPVTFFVQKDSSLWWVLRSRYRLVSVSSADRVTSGNQGANIQISIVNAFIT